MSDRKKRNLLSSMSFDEVSLVDKGANQHAKVVIAKHADGVAKSSPSPGDVHADRPLDEDEDEVAVKVRDDRPVMKYRDANGKTDPASGTVTHTPNAGGAKMPVNPDELPDEVVDYIEKSESYIDSLEADLADAKATIAKGGNKGDDYKKDEDEMDDVEKALSTLDDDQRAVFADIHKRAKDAEAVAKAERDLRLQREFEDRADSLSALPVEKSDVVEVLKALSDSPETMTAVEALLSKANEAVATSGAFDERGTSQGAGSAGDEAISHITKAAEVAKFEGTNEQAVVKAMEASPDLYDRYLLEQGS